MSTEQIISLLIAERDKFDKAIAALGTTLQRSGRQHKDGVTPAVITLPVRTRRGRTFTPAQRKAHAAKMKAYWAKRRKATRSDG